MLYYIVCIHNRLSYCLCVLYIFNTEHYSQYDENVKSLQKPTEMYDSFSVSISIPTLDEVKLKELDILGKWLVFKHYDEIDETWEKVRTAVVTDNLQGCVHAVCSTMRYDPTQEGPGPSTTGVICVYTEEHNIDAIGFKLTEIVQQDIKYKTESDSLAKKYVHKGDGKVTIKTIFWNNGRPSFVCEGKPCYGTSRYKEDIWYLNIVEAPKEFVPQEIIGRWILELENEELTELWHILKDKIECKTDNFGVAAMVCPPKRNRRSAKEQAVFHLYVGKEWKDSVGYKLIDLVETDIVFEQKRKSDSDCKRSRRFETLYWNNGEPDYKRLRKPTEIYNSFWVSISIPTPDDVKEVDFLGKWLVFKHYDEIDETWEKIRTAVVTDNLQGCVHAICSTMRYDPTSKGPGPSTKGVMCVFTEEHNMDAIGFKLIEIAQQDIKYKNESDSGKYAHTGAGKVTIKTIFWNNGRPSFVCEGKPCYGTSRYKEDIWYLNIVETSKEFVPQEIIGRWILELENEELTELWHILKDKIKCKTDNFGVAAMVCPPKRNRRSAEEEGVFHLYVGKEWKDSVGYKLIDLVETDIVFEQKRKSDSDCRRSCCFETLYWNNGEPDYKCLRRPTEIYNSFWVSISIPTSDDVKEVDFLGKWLLFKHYDEIDETWEKIRTAIVTDSLQGCVHAICSTMRYDPTSIGPGPSTTGVICVYTEEHNMDGIGFKLIEIAQQDIKYKTDSDTLACKYAHTGAGKVTIKTIFWNNGRPSFVCEDKPCYGTSRYKEDIWHLNVVEAPKEFAPKEIFGRWIVEVENEDLTELWHILKGKVECKTENFGVAAIVCPPKRNRRSAEEQAVFLLYVGKERKDSVGYKLIDLLETDIVFEHKRTSDSDIWRSHHYDTLYWNNGEPAYEIVTRPGITKNWRTGEDV